MSNFRTVVLVAGVLCGPAARMAPAQLSLEPHTFKARSGEEVAAEMGRLVVPEKRSRPGGKKIELAFVRFKSTAPKPGPPIVYLAGGPGGSGIGAAQGPRFPLFMAMREAGDVIALDQRGTGDSRPRMNCPQPLDYPLDRAADEAEFLRHYRERSRACAEHFRKQGIDLSAYNTEESADDLESLRRALGAEKISLWSISYGTHLALAALRRHQQRIHRVILAGVEGPDHGLKLPSNIEKNLADIARLARADARVGRSGSDVPDMVGLLKSVLGQLERPVTVEAVDPRTRQKKKVTIGRFDLELLGSKALGEKQNIQSFPALLLAMSRGDYSRLAAGAIGLRTQGLSAMSFAMDCASGVSAERFARVRGEEKGTLLGRTIDFPFPEVCDAWGVPELPPAFREPVKSSVPALFISGTLDGRTPVGNADEVRRGFGVSEHLVIEGAAHSDDLFLSSPAIKGILLEFMKGQPVSTRAITLPPLQFQPTRPAP